MGFSWAFFLLTIGHIEETTSVEFAVVAICPIFFHKITGPLGLSSIGHLSRFL